MPEHSCEDDESPLIRSSYEQFCFISYNQNQASWPGLAGSSL